MPPLQSLAARKARDHRARGPRAGSPGNWLLPVAQPFPAVAMLEAANGGDVRCVVHSLHWFALERLRTLAVERHHP